MVRHRVTVPQRWRWWRGMLGGMVTALVRRPGPRFDEGLVTHVERVPVDVELACRQWEGYVAALEGFGWSIVEVEPADDCPDAVFVEDTAVVANGVAVLAQPRAASRRDEVAGTERALKGLVDRITTLPRDATLDGGDVLQSGRDVWVGWGGRTNMSAITALRSLLGPRGRRVHAVPTRRVLHLKSAVTALPDGTVVGHEPLVDDPAAFPTFLAVPEEPGSHVVVVDDETVLVATGAPATTALLEARGLRVVAVDLSEFTKLEGCVTCLSIRVRD